MKITVSVVPLSRTKANNVISISRPSHVSILGDDTRHEAVSCLVAESDLSHFYYNPSTAPGMDGPLLALSLEVCLENFRHSVIGGEGSLILLSRRLYISTRHFSDASYERLITPSR